MLNRITVRASLSRACLAGVIGLMSLQTGCGRQDNGDNASPVQSAEVAGAPNDTSAADRRAEALSSPLWTEVDMMPKAWGGLHADNCVLAGPEQTRVFSYSSVKRSTRYYFTYIVFPANTGHAPEASVVPAKIEKVWQNEKWPAHYLFFSNDSYSQILVDEERSYGQHQSLDGQPWDMLQNLTTHYRLTDYTRWSVDLTNTEPYGDGPPCDPALAQPWQDIKFKEKNGPAYTVQSIMD